MRPVYAIFSLILFISLPACESNQPDEMTEAEIQLLYTENQSLVIKFVEESFYYSAGLSRMIGLEGRSYSLAQRRKNPRASYELYARFLHSEFQQLLNLAADRELTYIGGTTKILRAYIYFSMYDLFEDPGLIPIADSVIVTNPFQVSPRTSTVDAQANYLATIAYLDGAIADLERANEAPELDYFYQGDARKWIRLAKSLQLRAFNTIRQVYPDAKGKINELLSEGDLIERIEDDFEFKYSDYANNSLPAHPEFYNGFSSDGIEIGRGPLLSNYFMWLLVGEKGIPDPRRRYYFYRRVPNVKGLQDFVECNIDPTSGAPSEAPPVHYVEIDPRMPFCLADTTGYFGQDHLTLKKNDETFAIRTLRGLYPFGGKFDDDSYDFFAKTSPVYQPDPGNGILPILHASNISFIRAEAALTLGTDDDPKQMLEEGIRRSFDKVRSFEADLDLNSRSSNCGISPCPSIGELIEEATSEQEAYVAYVLQKFDDATEEEKLDIVMKEYLIALWGNGLEAYNNYRRTALPANIQPAYLTNSDKWIRSAPNYKLFDAESRTPDPVFWDVLDASLFR